MTSSGVNTVSSKPDFEDIRRRSSDRALLLLLLVLTGHVPALRAAQDPACVPVSPFSRAIIKYVIDGDTVILSAGEHVRMVGIDTPELDHDGGPDQPGAVAARGWLQARLRPGTAILIVSDHEDRDRHDRLLRHLFLLDGTNLQAGLLTGGLAVPLTIPPNLSYLPCYQAAATEAAGADRGLWGRPEYQPVEPQSLAADTRGFRIVRDQILQVHPTRDGAWLELHGPLSVTIPAASFSAFERKVMESLPGQWAEMRGMVYPHGGRLRMYLRHPVDLRLLENAGNSAATD